MPQKLGFEALYTRLEELLHQEDTYGQLRETLELLQEAGSSRESLTVHLERSRAANEATTNSEVFEDNSMFCLDMISGYHKGDYILELTVESKRCRGILDPC